MEASQLIESSIKVSRRPDVLRSGTHPPISRYVFYAALGEQFVGVCFPGI